MLLNSSRPAGLGSRPAPSAVARAAWRAVRDPLRRSLRAHALFIGIILTHALAAAILPPLIGIKERYSLTYYGLTSLVLTGIALAAFCLVYLIVVFLVMRPERPWRHIRNELGRLVTIERVCMALPLLVLFPVFAATFSYFKIVIPEFHPLDLDPLFAEWDRVLHGGSHPWELLQPLLGHPLVTTAINAVYHLWFGVTYGVILWLMVDTRRPRLRMRYLVTFLLMWIVIGNAMAAELASAGPVYYGRITGLADPYTPLMDYLRAANATSPVPALEVQELLWRWYADGVIMPGAGISAMPSLHVAVAFSFVLLGQAYDRRLALAGWVFTLLILIGSVHLGWHYAIDGYVAIIATWLLWHGVGWLLDRPSVIRLLWPEDETTEARPLAA
jgi:hypothetical protein